ncbi:MAG: hypothetical protein LBG26_03560 [Treponema sp.]|nr:hypothetical protein [Treponema sp.]
MYVYGYNSNTTLYFKGWAGANESGALSKPSTVTRAVSTANVSDIALGTMEIAPLKVSGTYTVTIDGTGVSAYTVSAYTTANFSGAPVFTSTAVASGAEWTSGEIVPFDKPATLYFKVKAPNFDGSFTLEKNGDPLSGVSSGTKTVPAKTFAVNTIRIPLTIGTVTVNSTPAATITITAKNGNTVVGALSAAGPSINFPEYIRVEKPASGQYIVSFEVGGSTIGPVQIGIPKSTTTADNSYPHILASSNDPLNFTCALNGQNLETQTGGSTATFKFYVNFNASYSAPKTPDNTTPFEKAQIFVYADSSYTTLIGSSGLETGVFGVFTNVEIDGIAGKYSGTQPYFKIRAKPDSDYEFFKNLGQQDGQIFESANLTLGEIRIDAITIRGNTTVKRNGNNPTNSPSISGYISPSYVGDVISKEFLPPTGGAWSLVTPPFNTNTKIYLLVKDKTSGKTKRVKYNDDYYVTVKDEDLTVPSNTVDIRDKFNIDGTFPNITIDGQTTDVDANIIIKLYDDSTLLNVGADANNYSVDGVFTRYQQNVFDREKTITVKAQLKPSYIADTSPYEITIGTFTAMEDDVDCSNNVAVDFKTVTFDGTATITLNNAAPAAASIKIYRGSSLLDTVSLTPPISSKSWESTAGKRWNYDAGKDFSFSVTADGWTRFSAAEINNYNYASGRVVAVPAITVNFTTVTLSGSVHVTYNGDVPASGNLTIEDDSGSSWIPSVPLADLGLDAGGDGIWSKTIEVGPAGGSFKAYFSGSTASEYFTTPKTAITVALGEVGTTKTANLSWDMVQREVEITGSFTIVNNGFPGNAVPITWPNEPVVTVRDGSQNGTVLGTITASLSGGFPPTFPYSGTFSTYGDDIVIDQEAHTLYYTIEYWVSMPGGNVKRTVRPGGTTVISAGTSSPVPKTVDLGNIGYNN